jgi:FkbM family methyltransferase
MAFAATAETLRSSLLTGSLMLPSPRRGAVIEWLTRADTNDGALVMGIIATDEYGLADLPKLTGTAIDIGAHIGTVALALAVDHPDLHVIAVEAVGQNVEVLRANIEHNHLSDRITAIEAAASAPGVESERLLWGYRTAENTDQAYVDDSRYIANIFDDVASDGDWHTVKAVSLDTLMEGADRLALLKIDCEGCEWAFLKSPRVKDVDLIIGEYHNGGGIEAVRALIGDTHDVRKSGGHDDVGMFRAVAR